MDLSAFQRKVLSSGCVIEFVERTLNAVSAIVKLLSMYMSFRQSAARRRAWVTQAIQLRCYTQVLIMQRCHGEMDAD
jgi:hypothetical protein